MDAMKAALAGPIALIYGLAGPITYILSVVDTWSSESSVIVKLAISLTLDVILAAIWPITWLLWIIWEAGGGETPLSTVLGF